ncbi:hypothetical protein GA0070216_108194 [Micromonospora matsumotoense]|uniref:Uncharacterized protein n=1 Tax=Micromonospora matsumotoense TaxID=121616 RepID=A0A1C4Z6B3_9ACTN|nr:hypothetical protein GA0070216_108194 [Micromonospora matsumotoense]
MCRVSCPKRECSATSATGKRAAVGNVTQNGDLYCGGFKVANYGRHVVASRCHFHGSRGRLTNLCSYRNGSVSKSLCSPGEEWRRKGRGHRATTVVVAR